MRINLQCAYDEKDNPLGFLSLRCVIWRTYMYRSDNYTAGGPIESPTPDIPPLRRAPKGD